jgi:hypothetical protein
VGTVFNRVDQADENLVKMILEAGMDYYGSLSRTTPSGAGQAGPFYRENCRHIPRCRGMRSVLEQIGAFGKILNVKK